MTATVAPTVRTLRITPAELKKHMDTWQPVTVLDVRAPQAYEKATKRIRGDIRVNPERLDEESANLPKDQLTVAYCT
jgi:rhodanese-related sulfurtransferase